VSDSKNSDKTDERRNGRIKRVLYPAVSAFIRRIDLLSVMRVPPGLIRGAIRSIRLSMIDYSYRSA
jgi:hypothetical protein